LTLEATFNMQCRSLDPRSNV